MIAKATSPLRSLREGYKEDRMAGTISSAVGAGPLAAANPGRTPGMAQDRHLVDELPALRRWNRGSAGRQQP